MSQRTINPELLRELLDYDPATGALTWRPRAEKAHGMKYTADRWNTRWAGKEAMTADDGNGYRIGKILGTKCHKHRVVWALVHGEWPLGEIDHKNHDRSDNRIDNLRHVTRGENTKNLSKSRSNTSGAVGVIWLDRLGKWQARIKVNGATHCLGCYADFDEAAQARKDAEWVYGFHDNHGT